MPEQGKCAYPGCKELATIECRIGACAPLVRWCDYHYEQAHSPEEKDWKGFDEQAKVDFEAIQDDLDAYVFITQTYSHCRQFNNHVERLTKPTHLLS